MKKILFISILSSSMLLSGCWETAKGEKIGVIVKCANEGIFIKTYECELIRGGMNNGSGSFGKSFHFTSENKNDISILEQALNSQKEVKITYHSELITLFRTETKNNKFLDSIKILN